MEMLPEYDRPEIMARIKKNGSMFVIIFGGCFASDYNNGLTIKLAATS